MLPSSAKSCAFRRTRQNALLLSGKDNKVMHYVYVLRCIDLKRNKRKFYTGVTDNLIERVRDHKSKSVETTKVYDKIELVYYEGSLHKKDAAKREKQIKKGYRGGYINKKKKKYLKKKKRKYNR